MPVKKVIYRFLFQINKNYSDNPNSSPGCHLGELFQQIGRQNSHQGGNGEVTSVNVEP